MKKVISFLMSALMTVSLAVPSPVPVNAHTLVGSSGIRSDSVYTITSKKSGKVLDVEGQYTHDGANVQQWASNGQDNQKWKVVSVGGGYYKLIAQHSGKALDVVGGYTNDGANVQQWTDNGSSHQRWKIQSTGDGYYKLIAECSGKALDVVGGYTNDGANVQQWSDNGNDQQKWKFTEVGQDDPRKTLTMWSVWSAGSTADSVTLGWCGAEDGQSGISYDVYVNDNLAETTSQKNLTVKGLKGNTTYKFDVQSKDTQGNRSNKVSVTVTTQKGNDDGKDTQAPTVPADLKVNSKTKNNIVVSWSTSTDNVGVAGYEVYKDGKYVGKTKKTAYNFTGLTENTSYVFSVKAYDAAGNKSDAAKISARTSKDMPVPKHDGFYINGTTLYDANGNPFVMRGISYPYCWFIGNEDRAIPAIKATGSNTVRLVLSRGEEYQKTSLSELQKMIRMCEENKLIVVVEVHDKTGSDKIGDLEKSANYWIEMKNALIGHEKTVILNIANEWGGKWDSDNWAAGYKKVIPMIRKAGIKNTIMVDCAGYGQYPKSIFERGRDVAASDSLKNTLFSIHMYEYAGGNENQVKENIDQALNTGYPVVIGEFGIRHKDGDVDEKTIMQYSTEKKVGYLGWSWSGNNSELVYLDMVENFDPSRLTEQGQAIINGTYGIKNTSKECSVFQTENVDKEAPSVPKNLKAKALSYQSIKLTWTKSTDNVGVAGYNIYMNGELIDISSTNSFTVKGLKAGKTYTFVVRAFDEAGNMSGKSDQAKAKTLESNDKEAPSVPKNLAGKASAKVIKLTWTESTDNIGVAGYRIYVDGKKTASTEKTEYVVSGLKPDTTYKIAVSAFDDAGNESACSKAITVKTGKGSETIDPGIFKTYTGWYVGINGGNKASAAKIQKLENGGYGMDFDLQTENYPSFQVDSDQMNLSGNQTMTLVITNPNAKAIQIVPIVKDNRSSIESWKELCQYQEIAPKSTVAITVPLKGVSKVERLIVRVQTGNGGFKGSVQLHTIALDKAEGAFDTAIAEMNRPKKTSFFDWTFKENSFGKTTTAGLKGETAYVTFQGVTDQENCGAGVSAETCPGLGKGLDFSTYSNMTCKITNTGKKAVHISFILRTAGGWVWQETGGQTAKDKSTERIVKPGETVEVTYDFNAPVWKSAATKWKNTQTVKDLQDVRLIQFKIYAGEKDGAIDGSVEITDVCLNF